MNRPLTKFDGEMDADEVASAVKQALDGGSRYKKTKHVTAINIVASQPWAITPDMLEVITSIAQGNGEGPEAVAAKLGRPLQNTRDVSVRDRVAIVPITGPIFRYANLMTELSGATSLGMLASDFNAALNDPAVDSIVLEIDSPGGVASGIAEFAQMVNSAKKPVIAYVDGMAASAAYWIAAAADETVISKTGEVGSIGAVFGVYRKQAGDVVEFVSSQSPMKRPDPESEDGRAELQRRIDSLAQVFIEDVAAYRNVSEETVLANFGQGGVRLGDEAVKLRMADRVSTLENVIAGLAGKTTKGSSTIMSDSNKAKSVAETPAITREYLTEHHADIVSAIESDAETSARAEGVRDERARIQAVLASPLANVHPMVIDAAIGDGSTPEQAAMAILDAESQSRTDALAAQKADAPKPVAESANQEDSSASNLPLSERCKAEWDKSATLQDEFNGNFNAFLAFKKADESGVARVLGK